MCVYNKISRVHCTGESSFTIESFSSSRARCALTHFFSIGSSILSFWVEEKKLTVVVADSIGFSFVCRPLNVHHSFRASSSQIVVVVNVVSALSEHRLSVSSSDSCPHTSHIPSRAHILVLVHTAHYLYTFYSFLHFFSRFFFFFFTLFVFSSMTCVLCSAFASVLGDIFPSFRLFAFSFIASAGVFHIRESHRNGSQTHRHVRICACICILYRCKAY